MLSGCRCSHFILLAMYCSKRLCCSASGLYLTTMLLVLLDHLLVTTLLRRAYARQHVLTTSALFCTRPQTSRWIPCWFPQFPGPSWLPAQPTCPCNPTGRSSPGLPRRSAACPPPRCPPAHLRAPRLPQAAPLRLTPAPLQQQQRPPRSRPQRAEPRDTAGRLSGRSIVASDCCSSQRSSE